MAKPGGKRKTIDKDVVYESLVSEILSGRIAPGTAISERAVVERFGLSRTPIREVLWRLERDNLISLHPNRGAFVKQLGTDEILELFQLREALEPLACALAATRRPTAELATLQAKFEDASEHQNMPADQLVTLGELLHDVVVRWSGNQMLLRIYESLRMQTHLMRNLLHESHELELDSMQEHLAILGAIERRDAAAARRAMQDHLRRSRLAILESLFGWQPSTESASDTADASEPDQHGSRTR